MPLAGPDSHRLPTTVQPSAYHVAIKTDLDASPPTFAGEAIIDLVVQANARDIVFNLHPSLTVTHLALLSPAAPAGTPLPVTAALRLDEQRERATVDVSAAGALAAGAVARLFICWEAELGGNMNGYYKSNGDPRQDGTSPIYALTQFEPTAARRAMPCWDEPLVKATFDISMIAKDKYTVLSNMDAQSSRPWSPAPSAGADAALAEGYEIGSTLDGGGSDWIITKFRTTPLMSTYLVAFACGEFAHLESEHYSQITQQKVPLRIYATPNQIEQAQMGLDVMKWALPVYEELFEIAYPLPKLDTLVAHDFDMGAMENWGLITGRTTAYLVNPRSSLAAKKRVGTVQCHELAHMWFGDIVTMKWWDNLWLNEAFATLMGSLVLPERIWPEWRMERDFITSRWAAALSLDARRSSHPIEVDCRDASQINQIFDAISYSKGASVLRMLMSVVGKEKFFKGVAIYLKRHLYGNAETQDLWTGISQAVGKDMGNIMANWTLKVGFPVISVEEMGHGELKLTQHRFLATGDVKPEEDETLWWVPLEIKTVTETTVAVDHDAVLDARTMTYRVPSDTFKLNADTIGVYRVAYSSERLAKLGKQAPQFSVEDRIGLMSDAAALAAAGYSKTSGALSFAIALAATETEFLPFSGIASLLGSIVRVWWENDAVRDAVQKVRRTVFRPLVNKMGYEHAPDDTPEVCELRALAVAVAAAAEDPDVVAELQARFRPFLDNGDDSRIPPDLQRAVFTAAARHGGAAAYDKLLATYHSPPNPSTKVDAMAALCAPRDAALLDRTFSMLGDERAIKDQDLTGLAGNRFARHRTAEYLMDQWASLNDRFSASFALKRAIEGVFGYLSSAKDLARVTAFFEGKDNRKYEASIAQTLEGMQAASARLARDTDDIRGWLVANSFL